MPEAALTDKDRMIETLRRQPEDSSYDELLKELAFARMVERGLEDLREGRTISNEEMRQKIDSWGK
jgi:predicted transcriptional regulator